MSSGVGSTKATVTASARSDSELQAISDGAVGTRAASVDSELKSRIVATPRNGQLHRTRLRFGGHLKSDQGNLIPENSSNTHCVAVFERPRDAESAIRELQGAGFDMRRLSLLGRDYEAEEHAGGPNAALDDVKYWAKEGTFWGGVFGVLFWPAFFFIPGIGPVLTAGLIGSALIGTVEAAAAGAIIGGTASALVAALSNWGIPQDVVTDYETDLKASRLLLIASGNAAELVGVRPILAARAAKVNMHSG
jgi:hypothetical protein